MNYRDLKNRIGKKVFFYIPTLKVFYKLEVTETPNNSLILSNYSLSKSEKIQGHEFMVEIDKNFNPDNFFYLTDKLSKESEEKGEVHFKEKCSRSWIFQ